MGRASTALSLAGVASAILRRSATRKFPPLTVADRLAQLPNVAPTLDGELHIRWSDTHIPFIKAQTERDGAVGLGIVQAHLRLAQMEVLRRAAYGRIAEVVGSAAVDLDALLRLIDFPRATEASLSLLPAQTRAWVDGFATGINAVIAAGSPPPEFEILGIEPQPWTAEDLFAVSRLCSADYAWRVWRALTKLRQRDDWAEIWAEVTGGAVDVNDEAEGMAAVPNAFVRDGSNAFAVAGTRTASGKPILACDPHLPIAVPSIWLIAGLRTPSITVWGLMLPALPIFGVGRNDHGAWGGTNLHAMSSELVDVAGEALDERETEIAVRGKRPVVRQLRQSEFGPVVSDGQQFTLPGETVALQWMGHRPSDDFTPYLDLMRARDFSSFADAVDGLSQPGLTMLWAGTDGDIAKLIACRVPQRSLEAPPDLIKSPEVVREEWRHTLTAKQLPLSHNPPEGFVTSANDGPADPPMTISHYYSAPYRVDRVAAQIGERMDLEASDLMGLQADTYLEPAASLAAALAPRIEALRPQSALAATLRRWDGHFDADSAGALAFVLIAAGLIEGLEAGDSNPLVSQHWQPLSRLTRLVDRASPSALDAALGAAVDAAEKPFRENRTWGSLHRLRLAHPLSRLPWLKPRLPSLDLPWRGSTDTLMKSMHPFGRERHATTFGANARFVADLSDPDGTFAVLLGGQDGWPGSQSMIDMVGRFRSGDSVALPVSEAALSRDFSHTTIIRPADD